MKRIKKSLVILLFLGMLYPASIQPALSADRPVLNPLLSLLLSGNSGSSGGNSFLLGGTVSGLTGTLVITNNGTDNLTITLNGLFNFSNPLTEGTPYSVNIVSAPAGYTCQITNGSGTMPANNVNNIAIACSPAPKYTVGGTVSGLTGTLIISNNGSDNLTTTLNGPFTFSTSVTYTHPYLVEIVTAPTGYDCTVTNAGGTMPDHNVTDINIACAVDTTPPNKPVLVGGGKTNDPLYTWHWTSGGGGNGTYRYNVNCVSPYVLDDTNSITTTNTQASPASPLPDGQYYMCVQERDDTGNWSASAVKGLDLNTEPPTVTVTSPAANATGVPVMPFDQTPSPEANLTVTFSKDMAYINSSDLTEYAFLEDSLGGKIPLNFYSPPSGVTDLTMYRFNHAVKLKENETYTATITTNVRDGYGNNLAQPYSWTFTTRKPLAYYPSTPNWNDYVKNDGPDIFSASGIACDPAESGGYEACIHSGEMRVITIPGLATCIGLTAVDDHGYGTTDLFNWTCRENGGEVRFVSTGLKEDARLYDLVKTQHWAQSSLVVTDTNGDVVYTSPAEQWWSNSVKFFLTQQSTYYLNEEGTVYLLYGSEIRSGKISISASKVALVGKPDAIQYTRANNSTFVSGSENFLWIEGNFDGRGDGTALSFSTRFSVLRNIITMGGNSTVNSRGGIRLLNSANNHLSDITSKLNSHGIWLENAHDNILENCTLVMNGDSGIRSLSSHRNVFKNIMSNNNNNGLELRTSTGNLITGLTATGNSRNGVYMSFGSNNDNIVTNSTLANNQRNGLSIDPGSHNNIFSNIALSGNGIHGLSISSSTGNTFQNLVTTDSGPVSNQFTFSNITDTYGVLLDNASARFTGKLIVGTNGGGAVDDCAVTGSSTGIATDCTVTGTSDFTLTTGATSLSSFIGKAGSDSVNQDYSAIVLFPDLADSYDFDWTGFERPLRAWGANNYATHGVSSETKLYDVGKFGCSTHFLVLTQGECDYWGDFWHLWGEIWDWNLRTTDVLLRNALTLPANGNAVNTVTHTWSDSSTSTFLRNAVESVGNGNGLCESGETCLYTPNIGSYQGHGVLQSAGTITSGDTLSGIALEEYSTNGY